MTSLWQAVPFWKYHEILYQRLEPKLSLLLDEVAALFAFFTVLRRFCMTKIEKYEEEKQKIIAMKLSSEEYEKAIQKLHKQLKL